MQADSNIPLHKMPLIKEIEKKVDQRAKKTRNHLQNLGGKEIASKSANK